MKIIELLFLVTLLLSYCRSDQLLHAVDGEVGRGNYTYYSLMYKGPITLYLHSTLGDADLYVSQVTSKPTFEPDSYCLQSSTCGLDVVHVPDSFVRPVGIGVYGHPSYSLSAYSLEVFSVELNDSYPDVDEAPRRRRADQAAAGQDYSEHLKIDAAEPQAEEERQEPFIWTIIWSFFDILLEVIFF